MNEEERKLVAIMFTDIAGYSAMMQKDEALTLELLQEHRKLLRPIFSKYGGREVETAGDSFFVEFTSALEAARCALEMQKGLFERNASAPTEKQIRIRIGLHVGDVVHLGRNVHGDKVNIAARIEPLAEPGGICITQQVYDQIHNQFEAPIMKLGRGELKNIREPMNIYKIVMPWEKKPLPFTERLKFKLRQKKAQQVVATIKTLLILAIVILAGLYIWQVWNYGFRNANLGFFSLQLAIHGPQSSDKHRIAVLPFINMSGDAENEYFSDGMTEEMISQLSKISDLEVIARTSVMTYKGKDKRVEEIGRELRVGTVLESSVRKAADRLRITVQLINTQNQAHLWAQTYDRDLKDVFAIQSDVAQKVAEALKVRLMAGEKRQVEKKGTEDLEAYNLYLKGRYYWNKLTKEGFQKAIEYFEQAIEKDPTYAQAYTGLADSYTLLGFYAYFPPREVISKAKVAAEKALKLDDTLAEAHASLALIRVHYDWDWSGAESALKRALSLNPNDAKTLHTYAWYLLFIGRLKEAIVVDKRVQELDPLSLQRSVGLGWILIYARQYDHAIEQCRKTLEMDPNFWEAHWCLGSTYSLKGMYEGAIAEEQKAIDLTGGGYLGVVASLGLIYFLCLDLCGAGR
jgi:TolB-like protein/class 3 adenylate cyclase